MKFFILSFLIILILYLGVNTILRGFARFLFGDDFVRRQAQARQAQKSREKEKWYSPKKKKKKVIDEDEGEYVDYEEVKK